MNLGPEEMRGRIERLRVVRLATVDESGQAHVVPVIFVVAGDIFYSPTDKPKNNQPRPKRLRNLDHDKRVTVLADFYDDDWMNAWWVRLRGAGRVVGESPERTHALGLVDRKYPQFDGSRYVKDGGPVLAVDINDWRGWAFSDRPAATQRRWPRRRSR
ncbi:MAG: pyridoxamine 5'-phosphate oxidase family protein [Streptosporangiaceae bacterium]